jgi:signal transduction histidine kinase
MSDRSRKTLAISIFVVNTVLGAASLVGFFLGNHDIVLNSIALVGLILWSGVGALIMVKTGNRIGWIFLVIGFTAAASFAGDIYVDASYQEPYVASLPMTAAAGWLANSGNAIAAMCLPLIFLWFPTGAPPSPRWRWVSRLWLAGLALSAALIWLRPGEIYGSRGRYAISNPLGVGFIRALEPFLLNVGTAALLAAAVLSIVSLFVRARRATGVERQQLNWLLLVGILMAANFLLLLVSGADPLWISLVILAVVGIPLAAAFAILRYRLYDIDVVISKTIVYAGLAILIGVAYVAIVVGVGQLVGAGTSSLGLQIAATALIAIGFEPVRMRLQRWANRLVYGKRATPYQVMAKFGHRMGEVPSADEVLADMADAAGTGVGAVASRVTLFLDGRPRSVTRPEDASLEDPTLAVPVTHAGEKIGELAVLKAANEPLRPAERGLLEDLAGHAGLALHNVRLTADLEAKAEDLSVQAEELRRSRERIVTARDAQRRRLERELRDGVGFELAQIKASLEANAERLIQDPIGTEASLDGLGAQANRALEELRDVARGIFPPLLVDQGLIPALEANLRKLQLDTSLVAEPALRTARFDPGVENAVYFCCTQALQNAQRHAAGARIEVTIAAEGDELRFEIRDHGSGFDLTTTEEGEGMQIMRDRMAALDGSLQINSEPGRGTNVMGRVRARALEAHR